MINTHVITPQFAAVGWYRTSCRSALALLLCAAQVGQADTGTAGFDDSDLLFVPLRWCIIQGSPAATNPGGAGQLTEPQNLLLFNGWTRPTAPRQAHF